MIRTSDANTISRQYAREEGYAAGVLNPSAINPYKGHDAGLAVPLAQSWQLGFDVARIHLSKKGAFDAYTSIDPYAEVN